MTDSTVETFEYGATRYWIEDGEVVVIYGSGNMSRDAVDKWAAIVLETVNQPPPGSTMYVLLDLTHPRQGFTPYSRTVVETMYRELPKDRVIFGAILMQDSIISQIVAALVNRLLRTREGVYQRMFSNREMALGWLRQMRHK
jgi:hypothetical protein